MTCVILKVKPQRMNERKMARSQAEKDASHRRIVKAAAAQIRRDGVDAVTVSELMREAGLTHGGFYRHFGSREDLIDEAIDAALADGSRQADTPGVELAQIIDGYVSKAHRDNPQVGCAVAALPTDVSRSGPEPAVPTAGRYDATSTGWSASFDRPTPTPSVTKRSSPSPLWSGRSRCHAQSTTRNSPTRSSHAPRTRFTDGHTKLLTDRRTAASASNQQIRQDKLIGAPAVSVDLGDDVALHQEPLLVAHSSFAVSTLKSCRERPLPWTAAQTCFRTAVCLIAAPATHVSCADSGNRADDVSAVEATMQLARTSATPRPLITQQHLAGMGRPSRCC